MLLLLRLNLDEAGVVQPDEGQSGVSRARRSVFSRPSYEYVPAVKPAREPAEVVELRPKAAPVVAPPEFDPVELDNDLMMLIAQLTD